MYIVGNFFRGISSMNIKTILFVLFFINSANSFAFVSCSFSKEFLKFKDEVRIMASRKPVILTGSLMQLGKTLGSKIKREKISPEIMYTKKIKRRLKINW